MSPADPGFPGAISAPLRKTGGYKIIGPHCLFSINSAALNFRDSILVCDLAPPDFFGKISIGEL
jgi:hypothetical protein